MEHHGVDTLNDTQFASFAMRVFAALMDGLLALVTAVIFLPVDWSALGDGSVATFAAHRAAWFVLLAWLVFKRGGTPGELLFRLRVVNNDGNFLSWFAAFRRLLIPLIGRILAVASIGVAVPTMQAIGSFDLPPHYRSLSMGAKIFGEPFATWHAWWMVGRVLDLVVVILNRRRRALHDYLGGSFVITKHRGLA